MSESVDTVLAIARDDLGACPERRDVSHFQTPLDSWDFMPVGRSGDSGATMWWWIDSFIESRSERYRISRALLGVDRFFANFERLGGNKVPNRFRSALKRTILQEMFPSPLEVAKAATSHCGLKAKLNLIKYVKAKEWLTRSWS